MTTLRFYLVIVFSLVISFAGLAFDLYFPLGVAGGVPYVALVLVGLVSRQSVVVLLLALLGSVLTVCGYYLSPPGGIHYVVLLNRALALFAIWATAIVSFLHLRAVAMLEPLAHNDPLTGLYNRYAFDLEVEKQMERFRRYGEPFSLILFDLDHFKQINDTHGHVAGDNILQSVADLCLYHLRRIDTVARIGGEEFAILLPNTHRRGAQGTATRLRRRIEKAAFQQDGGTAVDVTASFGVAELEHENQDLQDLMKAADGALYRAKEGGRNRVAVSSGRSGRTKR